MLRTVILGWEAACTINGVAFGIRSGRIDWAIDDEECGDSITAQAKAHKPGRFDAAVSLEFYERTDVSTTVVPAVFQGGVAGVSLGLQVSTGSQATILTGNDNTARNAAEIALTILPNFNTLDSKTHWIFPSFVLNNYSVSWDMDGKMQGSISGHSSSGFTPPTN